VVGFLSLNEHRTERSSVVVLQPLNEAPPAYQRHFSLFSARLQAAFNQADHCKIVLLVSDYQPVVLAHDYQRPGLPSFFCVFSPGK